ncbi:MAG: hypothetical protein ABI843_06830, partial [Dokdonella sp.]
PRWMINSTLKRDDVRPNFDRIAPGFPFANPHLDQDDCLQPLRHPQHRTRAALDVGTDRPSGRNRRRRRP